MELNWVAFTLCISLILIKGESSFATTATKNEICKASRREEEQCGSYAYKAMKPLLIYVELMRTKVENHDNITSIKNNEIEGLQMKISQYESDLIKNLREQIIAGLREQIIKKDSELKQQKFDQQNVYETIIQELRNYKNITVSQNSEIKELQKKLVDQNENVAIIQGLRNQIDSYKNNNDNLQSIRNELNKLNSQKCEECTSELVSKQKLQIDSDAIKSKEFQKQLEEQKKNIDQKNQEISKLKDQINTRQSNRRNQIKSEAVKSKEFQKQLEEQKKNIDQKNQDISKLKGQINTEEKNQPISKLQNDVKKSEMKVEDPKENPFISCTSFGDASGVNKISFSNYSFDVLCDSETAGPGWIVIQQRINGKEDFNRSWTTYREGFGSFDGDFFLGLEKIHRLTRFKPHELYIYLEYFHGVIEYERYKQFAIVGESDEYQLSLSGFSGNARNKMSRFKNNQKFSTYDRDNDGRNDVNCALKHLGGWWYNDWCGVMNLNSKYYNSISDWHGDGMYWRAPVKNVKMIIRPK
ncbi:angiopoietin-related protein 7-like [Drosophila grimshawi]|uniref:angiopoietin-related protein 7-like n=1 Tax=Drosophila grimshawi TaxID=7222 RepID=UPI001C931F33|nr:angiopoietin-related protein 7-like [Drosophila grimshawi]